MDLIESVTQAMEYAVGIKQSIPDMQNGCIHVQRQEPDSTELRKLYHNNVSARRLIDMIIQLGEIDRSRFGL